MERPTQTRFSWLGEPTGMTKQQPVVPAGLVTIAMRCAERGMDLDADARAQIGREAIKNWRQRFAADPGSAPEFVNGKTIMVSAYPREHAVEIIDPALDAIVEAAAARAQLASGKFDVSMALGLVEKAFGIALRDHQRDALTHLCNGKDVILHVPTGGGKSVVFQGAARIFGPKGLTVVLYPLRALVEDQRLGAEKFGVDAVSYYGATLPKEREIALARIESDKNLEMILTVPEMFTASPKFRAALQKRGVSLLVIDEAHVYDEWALSFRNSYQLLGRYLADLSNPQLLLCSATLTAKGAVNAARALRRTEWGVVRVPAIRDNLVFANTGNASDFLRKSVTGRLGGAPGPGIAFFTWANSIASVCGLPDSTLRYSGKLTAKARKHAQETWTKGNEWILATKAFGMGIDKANVRSIFHAQLSTSVLDYAQEVGRAGRDGQISRCYMPDAEFGTRGPQPLGTAARFLIDLAYPDLAEIRDVWKHLKLEYGHETDWVTVDPKGTAEIVFGTDKRDETVRKCIGWLQIAGMVEKQQRPDRWLFYPGAGTKKPVQKKTIEKVQEVEDLVRQHGTLIGDAYMLMDAEVEDILGPVFDGKGWRETLKDWSRKSNYIQAEWPGPRNTTIKMVGTSFSDFDTTAPLLAEIKRTANKNFQDMLRVATARPEARAGMIEKLISLDMAEFDAGMEKLRTEKL